jgi:hypothetical protein
MSVVERLSGVLERRLTRRSFVVRSAFVGSALTAGGLDFVLRPGSAYAALCSSVYCGDPNCSCSSTCCGGYTEFCCALDGGYNSCPSGTVMGGWWMADGSAYCSGARYYMDCNAVCQCTTGCGNGSQFCDTSCDGLTCECAGGSCDNYLTGCFQFRYGQCNQNVSCVGRIKCRVVTCVPPWQFEPSCTTASATDDGTADQNAPCLGPDPTYPPPPKPKIRIMEDLMFLVKTASSATIYCVSANTKVGIPQLSDLEQLQEVLKAAGLDYSVHTISTQMLDQFPSALPDTA